MNHTQAIREIMVLNDVTLAELGRRIGMTHVGVLTRIRSKTGKLHSILQLLEEMEYEMVIRPQTEGELLEGEYVLRFRDYPSVWEKSEDEL